MAKSALLAVLVLVLSATAAFAAELDLCSGIDCVDGTCDEGFCVCRIYTGYGRCTESQQYEAENDCRYRGPRCELLHSVAVRFGGVGWSRSR